MNFLQISAALLLMLPAAGLMPAARAAALSPAERAAAVHYSHMLDAAKANPAGTDWIALRAAYAASPAYDPGAGHTPAEADMATALQGGDFRKAASLADAATSRNWMDFRAHLMGYLAYSRLTDPLHSSPHQAAAQGINKAILATGNGVTPVTALHVLATSEEYVELLLLHYKMRKQQLVHQGGHDFDRLNVTHEPDGAPAELWFNIDTSLAREGAVAIGRAVPMADGDLPR